MAALYYLSLAGGQLFRPSDFSVTFTQEKAREAGQGESGGAGGGGGVGSWLPQVEEDVGLLVQNHLDVTGVNQGVIHLVPLSVACLKQQRVRMKTK